MLYHSGIRVQRGQGIGSILGGLFRSILPKVAKSGLRAAGKIARSDIAKDVGRQLRDTATRSAVNMAVDALEGRNVKESLQNQLESAKQDIATSVRKRVKRQSKRPAKKNKPAKSKRSNNKRKGSSFFDD